MKNLNALIKSLHEEAKSDWAIKDKVDDMYLQDAKDATTVGKLLKSNIVEAAEFIRLLDTSIRESIVVSVAKDRGNDWVEQNLGWSVR
jgi:hypothetical protein